MNMNCRPRPCCSSRVDSPKDGHCAEQQKFNILSKPCVLNAKARRMASLRKIVNTDYYFEISCAPASASPTTEISYNFSDERGGMPTGLRMIAACEKSTQRFQLAIMKRGDRNNVSRRSSR